MGDHNSVEYVNFKAGKRGDQANHRPPVTSNPEDSGMNMNGGSPKPRGSDPPPFENIMDMDHNSVEYVNFKAGKRGDQANHRPPVPLNPDEYVDHNSAKYVSMKEQGMVDQNVKAMKDHYSEEYVNAKVNSVHPAPRDDPYDPNHPVFTDHKLDEFEFHQDIERLQHDISVFENELAKIEAKHDEKVEGIFSN